MNTRIISALLLFSMPAFSMKKKLEIKDRTVLATRYHDLVLHAPTIAALKEGLQKPNEGPQGPCSINSRTKLILTYEDFTKEDFWDETPLHWAAKCTKNDWRDRYNCLITHGADQNLPNMRKKTALQLYQLRKQQEEAQSSQSPSGSPHQRKRKQEPDTNARKKQAVEETTPSSRRSAEDKISSK